MTAAAAAKEIEKDETEVEEKEETVEEPEKGLVFKKYTSFDNLMPEDVEELIPKTKDERWVVLEKVHGSNFSFITDGKDVIAAKRTALLPITAKFFDFRSVVEKYRRNVITAFQSAKTRFPEIERLHVFGELYGGTYKHPDVAPVKGALAVQKQISYTPAIEFCAFDLSPGKGFLDYDVAMAIFEEAGIPHARPLLVGTFAQAAAFNPVFQTTLPTTFGLPPIDRNEAEGVVIKRMRGSRPIFKHKNPMFAEITGTNRPPAHPGQKLEKAAKRHEAEAEAAAALADPEVIRARSYVNANRLASVISKEGEVTASDGPRLIGLLAKDALDDFAKDCAREQGLKGGSEEWKETVPKPLLQRIKKSMPKFAAVVVEAHFQKAAK